jgi:hypothetical protein
MMDGTDVIAGLGGLRDSAPVNQAVGMSPKDKVALALQAHRGLFPQQSGMGGLSSLGQAGLGMMGMMQPRG